MKQVRLLIVVLVLFRASVLLIYSHESPGRGGHKDAPGVVESELEGYFGRHGYYHFGLGVQMSVAERHKLGVITHLVREDAESGSVSSLGVEYGLELEQNIHLELFSFGYFPAREQDAWGIGLRVRKEFEAGEHLHISPFFGPTFARVRAIDEETEEPTEISHTLLFGGVMFEWQPIELMLFGSHSFFSRSPRELESHVDLEEMTHFAVYENNDGLARNSVGMEARWQLNEAIGISARYAAIFFSGQSTRHSVMAGPAWQISKQIGVFGGAQLLRGGPGDNEIGYGGVSYRF